MAETLAYINWGRVVGDCGVEGCYDASELAPGQAQMVCILGHVSQVRWSHGMPAVLAALGKRPDESKRNWFPRGHPIAVAGGFPQDQSPAELEREQAVNELAAETAQNEKRERVRELLAELGVKVHADGRVEGVL